MASTRCSPLIVLQIALPRFPGYPGHCLLETADQGLVVHRPAHNGVETAAPRGVVAQGNDIIFPTEGVIQIALGLFSTLPVQLVQGPIVLSPTSGRLPMLMGGAIFALKTNQLRPPLTPVSFGLEVINPPVKDFESGAVFDFNRLTQPIQFPVGGLACLKNSSRSWHPQEAAPAALLDLILEFPARPGKSLVA